MLNKPDAAPCCNDQFTNPMHIGIAGPVDLSPLRQRIAGGEPPPTYSFPLVGQLADALLDRGHSVSIFSGSNHVADTRQFEGERLRIFVCPLRAKRSAYDFYAHERKHLAQAMRGSGCDIIHAHWTYEFAAAALDDGRPCLITAHDSPLAILRYFVLTRHFPFWIAKSLLGINVIRRAKHLTAVSPYCKRDIECLLKPTAPISVVPNGVQQKILEMGRARMADGNPPLPLVLATVLQGFQKRKNAQTALRAFALIRHHFPDATFKMFGADFEPGGSAETWSRKYRLDAGVCFRGGIAHDALMRELSTDVHVLLHPAREESFGMAPLEAMSLGIPVVGGIRSGGVPYVLGEGRAGRLVDIRNPQEITHAILQLVRSSGQLEQAAQAGWKHAASCFSFDKMVDAYQAEYLAILEGRRGRAA